MQEGIMRANLNVLESIFIDEKRNYFLNTITNLKKILKTKKIKLNTRSKLGRLKVNVVDRIGFFK